MIYYYYYCETIWIFVQVAYNPIRWRLFEVLQKAGGLVSKLWGPHNSKTQISQTDNVLRFHLSFWSASWVA